jgi:hypothetical protein
VEQEFRIVYAGPDKEKTVRIKFDDIDHITVTDKMPEPLFKHFKQFITGQYGINTYRTTITENHDWINQFGKKEIHETLSRLPR